MSVNASRISILVAQFPISLAIERNVDSIAAILDHAKKNDLIVLPEGAVSGYADNPAFLQDIDPATLAHALQKVRGNVVQRGLHLICGSCLYDDGCWYNAGLYFGPGGEQFIYHKVNLATGERGYFTPGSQLPVFQAELDGCPIRFGIQLCREVRFPEQWQYLARQGAQLFAYLTNAVDDPAGTQAPVWRSHLISRAAENQRFVVAANNAAEGQKCPSMVVAPDGRVLWEVLSPATMSERCEIDLSEVSNWYLNQSRTDVVRVLGNPEDGPRGKNATAPAVDAGEKP